MIVKLIEFKPGSDDGLISNKQSYSVELKSGVKIDLFDFQKYDLRDYLNKEIECLIQPWITLEPPGFEINGKFIGKIKITSDWLKFDKNLDLDVYFGIKTLDGLYLIDIRDIEEFNLKVGSNVKFYADRIDLLSWRPIE